MFILNSVLLGVGLAMDAFSVSLANGLNDIRMNRKKMNQIAGTFAAFQFLMPMIGWLCVHTIVTIFQRFETYIPWIALLLLAYIGGKMVWEGIHSKEEGKASGTVLTNQELLLQGIATSIDALSVGFTISDYSVSGAFLSSLIIAAVTYVICVAGVRIGKKAGTKLSGKASILGGIILIIIGIEIFIG